MTLSAGLAGRSPAWRSAFLCLASVLYSAPFLTLGVFAAQRLLFGDSRD